MEQEEPNALPEDMAQIEEMADAGIELSGGFGTPQNSAEQWKQTLKKTVNSVVVLKVKQLGHRSSYATGFIVDKKLGLILTNRHVVTPAPIVAEAVFQNREEVPVSPIYYDPIHDFGFFRFDPKKLKFISPEEIELAPDAAAVGLDIRVVGNDSGEKISILSGTLARLDRDAPHYGRRHYNDFNTFYLQAASGTKGGSSGSPVIDISGRAVALNAGGKNKAASAYYLPLDRVVRALEILRACALPDGVTWKAPHIPRGDLQATFLFKGFDEVKRLGLQPETESAVRVAQAQAPQEANGGSTGVLALAGRTTGMLVVDSIVPGGPADGALETGDVLVRLNGDFVSDFLTMEDLFDSKAGQTVTVEVERGGKAIKTELLVQDLHAVTPNTFLEIGGGSVHELSYQQARNNRSPVGQVYIAEPGYLLGKAGCPKYSIITALAGKPTPNLEAFTKALLALAHGQRVPLDVPMLWKRDDASGVWNPTPLWPEPLKKEMEVEKQLAIKTTITTKIAAANEEIHLPGSPKSPKLASPAIQGSCARKPPRPPNVAGKSPQAQQQQQLVAPAPSPIPRQHSVPDVAASSDIEKAQAGVTAQGEDNRLVGSAAAAAGENGGPEAWRLVLEERLRAAMVLVDVEIPLVALADGVHSRAFSGAGIIVHLSKAMGLVLVDRNTVSIGCGDIMLSLGAYPAEIPARVRFLHPLHNFALLSFDPSELSEDASKLISAVKLAPSPPLRRGEAVELVSLSKSLRILHRTSMVTNPAMAVLISQADVPRFRAVHEEVIKVDQDFGVIYSGLLADRHGAVRALWGSYSEQVDKDEREWSAGLATSVFLPWVNALVERLDPSSLSSSASADLPVALPPCVRVLDAELEPLLLSKAAQFGLSSDWVAKLMALDPERRQVLRVRSTVAGSPAQSVLKDGDMVLAVAGQPVSSFWDVEKIIQGYGTGEEQPGNDIGSDNGIAMEVSNRTFDAEENVEDDQGGAAGNVPTKRPVSATNGEHVGNGSSPPPKRSRSFSIQKESPAAMPAVPLTIFRSGQVLETSVKLGVEDGLGTDRLVHWCGAQLQAPHRGVRELGFMPDGAGVYISRWHHGSPAHRFGLYALHWIVEVNGVPTPDLDTFLATVQPLKDGDAVRIKVVHFESTRPKVLTLKMDLRYWPTWELKLDAARGEWSRNEL